MELTIQIPIIEPSKRFPIIALGTPYTHFDAPDATFDNLFVRPKSISSKPTITPVIVSDHYPVVRRIDLQD